MWPPSTISERLPPRHVMRKRLTLAAAGVFMFAALTVACSGSGTTIGGPPPIEDQNPNFNDQDPLFDDQQQPALTPRVLCIALCDAAERCLPPGTDCLELCLTGLLGQLSLDECLDEPGTGAPPPEPDPPMGCVPAAQCQSCPDPCAECLCNTGGDAPACEMQGLCFGLSR